MCIRDRERLFIKGSSAASAQVQMALEDSYKRLLQPSMETETLQSAKERADLEAIRVFAENMRQLLLSPPMGEKNILALDPGFRTGCKVVCLDKQGNFIHNEINSLIMNEISLFVEANNLTARSETRVNSK